MRIQEVAIIKTKSDKVLARADVHFEGFWMKGFKILRDQNTAKDYVTPPSYVAGTFWRPLFKTDSREDWQEIQRRILEEYNNFLIKETAEEMFTKEED